MKHLSFSICIFFIYSFSHAQLSLQWANQTGGTGHEANYGMGIDASGNVFTGGIFQGTADFDAGAGSHTFTSKGAYDVVISKTDGLGNFLWAKHIGGKFTDHCSSLNVDASGNVLVSGWFADTVDFDPGAGVSNLIGPTNTKFLLKLDNNGNFVWARTLGGSGGVYHITSDVTGNVYAIGIYAGTEDFDPGTGVANLTSVSGSSDAFVVKLNAAGNFVWVRSFGGPSSDVAYGVAVDAGGNVFVGGGFFSTADFDPGTGVFNLTSSGSVDIYIAKLDASGNFVFAVKMGGTGNDGLVSLALDNSGNIISTGSFNGTADFDPSGTSFPLTSIGSSDSYISKLDGSGNFVWAKRFGSSSFDNPSAIVTDDIGKVYVTGYCFGVTDFDPGAGTYNLSGSSDGTAFMIKLDASGVFDWAAIITGSVSGGHDIAVDKNRNVYVTGMFQGYIDSNPLTPGNTFTSMGAGDIYLLKLLGPCITPAPTLTITPSKQTICMGEAVTMTVSGAATYSWNASLPDGNIVIASPTVNTVYSVNAEDVNLCAGSASIQISVVPCTGIEDHSISKLNLYPNPSNGNINFHSVTEQKVMIYNGLGQVVEELHLSAANGYRVKLELAAGIYFATSGNDIQKIVVAE